MKNNGADIQFQDFRVLESHIIFKEKDNFKINIAFKPSGKVYKSKTLFVLNLGILVRDENEKFSTEVVTESDFTYNSNDNLDRLVNSLFILNAPAIVFPYIRAFITNITSQSGMTPLVLPTLNLSNLGEDLKNNIEIIEE